MTGKIFKSVFISALVMILVAVTVVFFSYLHFSDSKLRQELKREAEFVMSGIELCGEDYLDSLDYATNRISWISSDGTVLFDSAMSEDGLAKLDNHLDREEVKAALDGGEGYSVRYSDTTARRSAYYALRMTDGSVIRISAPGATVLSAIGDVWGTAVILLITVSLLAFALAKGLAMSIVRPINEIDPEYPESAAVYEELKPIAKKLSAQSYKISRQLAELKKKESEFNSITSNMSAGMIVINSKTVILSCNNSAKEILGVSGEVPRSVLSLDNSKSFREAISSALSGKNGYDTLKRGERHYSILITPVFDEGLVEGAVIAILDDTEKEEREVLRREFTSNVSHELKTPLTSISGFAELISCGMADIDEARHFASNIKKEASRLISLVGDIIRLTQLDGGEIPYDGEIDLFEVANEVAERLTPIAQKTCVTIEVTGESATVLGTYKILDEIIHNLCDNAIKYNREGGAVKVTVGSCDGAPFVSVEDGGIGIPKDQLDRVFERFYRVDKSQDRKSVV